MQEIKRDEHPVSTVKILDLKVPVPQLVGVPLMGDCHYASLAKSTLSE